MRAVRVDAFGEPPRIVEAPEPRCPPRGAVVRVVATGVCRSDVHAWRGHDPSVAAPYIPGHEFAGVVERVDPAVTRFRPGDRVTAPFVFACGACAECRAGAPQVCTAQRQPGFTLPGTFADRVAVTEADLNLVALPDAIGFAAAAELGCRFATAWHALHARGRLAAGEWVAVHGCGGVGLSAVHIARAAGARVVAVDPVPAALDAARALGAVGIPAGADAVPRIRETADGGAHLALDAFGSRATCLASLASLRPRGRHVQVGLLLGADADPPLPMGRIVADELEVLGSHGIAVAEYDALLAEIVAGRLDPSSVVGRTIGFDGIPDALADLGRAPSSTGLTVALLDGTS